MMALSSLMHWLLGQSISTREVILLVGSDANYPWERSEYEVNTILPMQ